MHLAPTGWLHLALFLLGLPLFACQVPSQSSKDCTTELACECRQSSCFLPIGTEDAGVAEPGGLDGGPTRPALSSFLARGPLERQLPVANSPPTAVITVSPAVGVPGVAVAFHGNVQDADGTVASVRWSFGDGATSTVLDPEHTFLAQGHFRVGLTVADNGGAVGETSVEIEVAQPAAGGITVAPTPQRLLLSPGTIALAGPWDVVFDPGLSNVDRTVEIVTEALLRHPGVTVTAQAAAGYFAQHGSISQHPARVVYLLSATDARVVSYFEQLGDWTHDLGQHLGGKGFGQGYLLLSKGSRLFDLGQTAQGTYYGAQTLRQILEQATPTLPAFTVIDYPDLERRVYYPVGHENPANVRDPSGGLTLLDQMARHKMNAAHFSSGSMGAHMDTLFGPYATFARRNFIRPILAPALPVDLECAAEGFSVVDEPFTFASDLATGDLREVASFQNLDFESGVLGATPASWSVADVSAANGQWRLTDQDHAGGARSVVLERDEGHLDSRPMLRQTVGVPANSWYLAEFRVKTASSRGGGNYQFLLYGLDASNTPLFYRELQYAPVDDGQWHTLRVHLAKSPVATRLMVWIRPAPTLRGTIHLDDLKVVRMNAELANVLLSFGHRFRVTDTLRSVEYVPGQDYTLTTTGGPLLTSADLQQLSRHTSLARLPTGRIAAGQTVLVSFDYLFAQDKSTSRNYNPFVDCGYQRTADLFANLANQFVSRGFSVADFDLFLAQDEIRGFNMDSRSTVEGKPNYEALALHLNRLRSAAVAAFPSARVYAWADMLDPRHNGGNEQYQVAWGGPPGRTAPAIQLLHPGFTLIPWWYDNLDASKVMRESSSFFNRAGLRVAGGAGANLDNIKYWSAMLRGTTNELYGHSIFSATLSRTDAVREFAEYSWHAYSGDLSSVAHSGQFELCNGKDDDGDGAVDEDYALATDADHCGQCSHACAAPRAIDSCNSGVCSLTGCLPGFEDRNGDPADGCEAVR